VFNVLVAADKRLRAAGGSLGLICTDENLRKIFEITGLDQTMPIYGSRDEALSGAPQRHARRPIK
jgi:anti-sigma B factor antagonist